MKAPNIVQRFLDFWGRMENAPSSPPQEEKNPKNIPSFPTSRVSQPVSETGIKGVINELDKKYRVVDTDFCRSVIKVIRKLSKTNPDVSQALQNIVNLGNTGHRIHFDRGVSDEYAAQMRNHITNKHKSWATGQAGADGLVNRFFTQLMIGGALSIEKVPANDLSTVESVIMVPVETIWFRLNARKTRYEPYQQTSGMYVNNNNTFTVMGNGSLKKLNPLTYSYYALNGDGEIPYGFPPYLAVLEPICVQREMNSSINNMISQLGLLGFLEVLIQAPEQGTTESDDDYQNRLTTVLASAKSALNDGIKDGIMVGFNENHTFQFHSIARDFKQVVELYKQNELQVASALKQDATLWGRDYNTSETQISVIFMKMLAEMKNIQNIIKTALEEIYVMELRLAGFNFDYLTVEFNRSTIQDDLKFQQALEIKERNYRNLYIMGSISQAQYSLEVAGVEYPDQDKPRVSDEVIAGASKSSDDAQQEQKREKDKDASDKKTRDKNKPQGSKKS